MATVEVDGIKHTFAGNPVLQGEVWADEYPPITADVKWLRNKSTGEIVPNHPEFAERSDILEAYYGDPTGASGPATSQTVPNIADTVGVLTAL